MPSCDGYGSCLNQVDENTYELYENVLCEHNCTPKKCPNYLVCRCIAPEWYYHCHRGTCMNCAMMWGNLEFTDNIECPICFETKKGVKQLKCDHKICVDCFRRCNYGEKKPQPVFPYSNEIEEEHDEDHDNPKWLEDPLIVKYRLEWIQYEIDEDTTYEKEASLRICSICRK
jgi:hypothetical protein